MGTTLLDEVIHTDYGQFDILWEEVAAFDGDTKRFFDGQVNGWVGASSGAGIYIHLARRSGGSRVTIMLEEVEPPVDDHYQDVVEVSATIPPGAPVNWLSWGGMGAGPVDVPPGTYRVRVSAHDRDAGAADEFAEGVVDSYLVEFWPAPLAPDAIVRCGSADAAYWHAEWGGRRPT